MTTSSTYIQPIAEGIVEVIEGLSGLTTVDAPGVKGILWAPRDTDRRPAGVVEMPAIERVAADEAESQISTRDVRLRFPVPFYFDLSDDLAFAQSQAVEVIEAFIDALDASPNAGNPLSPASIPGATVIDAKTSTDPPEIFPAESSSGRPSIRYVCRVDVLAFIPDV